MKTTENEHSVEYTRLPPELWLHILSFLRTAELLDVVCLSSTFYHLALPLLYENVSWVVSDEQAFLKSSPCTQALVREMLAMDGGTSQMGERRNGSLFEHVRACRIVRSFSSFAQSAARSRQRIETFNTIAADYAAISAWRKERDPSIGALMHLVANHRRRTTLPSTSLASSILLMNNLRTLVLSNVTLPGELINSLPGLHHLEELELERCKAESILILDQTQRSDCVAEQHISEDNGIHVQLLLGDPPSPSKSTRPPLFNPATPRWPPRLTRVSVSGMVSVPPMFDFRMHGDGAYDVTRIDGVEQLYATIISPHLRFLRTTSEAFKGIFEAYKRALLIANSDTEEHYIPSQLTDFRIVYSNADGGARRLFDLLESFGHRLHHLEIAETTKEECVDFVMLIRDRLGMAPFTLANLMPFSGSHSTSTPFLESLQSFTGPSCLAPLFFQASNIKSLCIRDSFSKVANDILWRDGTHHGALLPGAVNGPMLSHLAQNIFGTPVQPTQDWTIFHNTPTHDQAAHPKAYLLERIERQVTTYLTNALHTNASTFKGLAGALERLEFTVVRWDIDLLWMVVNELPQLTGLEIRCLSEAPDSQFFMSFWGNFLPLMPKLVALHIYNLSKSSLSESSNKDPASSEKHTALDEQRFALRMISRARPAFSSFSMTRAIIWNAMAHRTPAEIKTGRGWGYTVRDQWIGVLEDDPFARPKLPIQKARSDPDLWKARSESPMHVIDSTESSDEEMTLDSIRPYGAGRGKSLPRGTVGPHEPFFTRRHSAHGQRGKTSGKHVPSRLRNLDLDDSSTSDSRDGDDEWVVPDSEYEVDGPLSSVGRRVDSMQSSTMAGSIYASPIQSLPQLVPNYPLGNSLGGLFPDNFGEDGFTPMGNETFDPLAYEGAVEVDHSQVDMGSHPYGHHSSSSFASSVLSHPPSIGDLSHPVSHATSLSGRSRSQSTHSFGFQPHDAFYANATMTNEVPSRRGSLDNYGYDADLDYEEMSRSAQSLVESSSSHSVQSSYASLGTSQFGWANTTGVPLSHPATSSLTSLSIPHTACAPNGIQASGFNVDYQYGSSPYDPSPYDAFEQLYSLHHPAGTMYDVVAPAVTGTAGLAGYETDTSIYDTGALFDGTYERRSEEMQMQLDKEAEGRALEFMWG